jgi:hypothetical protein
MEPGLFDGVQTKRQQNVRDRRLNLKASRHSCC